MGLILRARIARLERQRATGWPGYPPPIFSDAHLAEAAAILAAALGSEATLAHIAERTGATAPTELARFIREREGAHRVGAR